MADKAENPYGLIFMKKQASGQTSATSARQTTTRSIFDDSDDEGTETTSKKPSVSENRVKKQVQKEWEKALEDDPNAFAYDEVYDQMSKQRVEKSETKKADKDHKPKYIQQLLRTAEKRQHDYEAREERKQQKELEKDAEMYADKEVFVTAAYRKKMEELEKFNQEERRKEQIEAMMDVTKQKDLSGFYRHFLNDFDKATTVSLGDSGPSAANEDGEKKKHSESARAGASDGRRHRTYRQRHHSGSSSEDEGRGKEEKASERRRTRSESRSDDEFHSPETVKKSSIGAAGASSSKTLTRAEKQRRRYFTPSPPPSAKRGDDNRRRKRDEDPDRASQRKSSAEKSPKRKRQEETTEDAKEADAPVKKVLTEEEAIQARMDNLRRLFARRNNEESIEEYKKRYLERKAAVSVG